MPVPRGDLGVCSGSCDRLILKVMVHLGLACSVLLGVLHDMSGLQPQQVKGPLSDGSSFLQKSPPLLVSLTPMPPQSRLCSREVLGPASPKAFRRSLKVRPGPGCLGPLVCK